MCCVIYYIYLKYRNYFQKRRITDTNAPETLYTARTLDEYVKNKERTYWTSYTK